MSVEKDARYWRVYYKIQELLEREFLHCYTVGSIGDVRAQSTLPHELNAEANKVAEYFMNIHECTEPEQSELYKSLQEQKEAEQSVAETMGTQVIHVTKASYMLMIQDLEPDLRAFISDDLNADNYMLIMNMETQQIRGGFAYSENGNISGIFSFEKGFGRDVIGIAIATTKQYATDLYESLYVDCYGNFLAELYAEFGFMVTETRPWNDELATEGWNYERFGRPIYYEMELKL